jgi:hypothetical protein
MADRLLRSKATGKVMSESQLFQFDPDAGTTPGEVYDNYLKTGQYEPAPPRVDMTEFPKNIVRSTARLGLDTVQGIGKAVLAVPQFAGHLYSLADGSTPPEPPDLNRMVHEGVVNTGRYLKNRYVDNLGKTLYEDPAGVASDVATVGSLGATGASAVARGLSKFGATAGAAERVSDIARGIKLTSDFIDPITGVTKIPQAAMNRVSRTTGKPHAGYRAGSRIYQSVMGPKTTGKSLEELEAMVRTGLKEEIGLSKEGMEKAQGIARGIDQYRDITVDAASQGGATVDPRSAVNPALKYRATVAGPLTNPKHGAVGTAGKKATREIDREIDTFMTNHGGVVVDPKTGAWGPPVPMTVQEANEAKKSTYRVLGDKNYDNTKHPQGVETTKKIVSGLKAGIDQHITELKELGVKERDLLNLVDAIEDHIKSHGSRNILGQSFYSLGQGIRFVLGSPSASGGAAVTRTIYDVAPETFTKMAIAMARDHTVASKIRSKLRAVTTPARVQRENEANPVTEPPTAPINLGREAEAARSTQVPYDDNDPYR